MKKIKVASAFVATTALLLAVSSCSKAEQKPAPVPAAPAANETPAKTPAPTPAPAAEEPVAAAPALNMELVNKQIEGIYLSANDLEVGVLTAVTPAEDGFSLNASEEKTLEVQDITKDPVTVGDDTFTKRITTKGSGKADLRNISFPAKEGDSIIVYCGSSSKSDARPLHVVDFESGEEIGTITMGANGSKDITVDEVKVSKDGTYCVYSTSGAGYIYQIKVGK